VLEIFLSAYAKLRNDELGRIRVNRHAYGNRAFCTARDNGMT